LADEFTLSGALVLVVGMLEGRDPTAVLEALRATEAGFLVACTPPSPRAIPAAQVAAAADSLGIVAEAVPDVHDAVRRALAFASDDLASADSDEGDEADDVRSWDDGRRSAATTAELHDLSDEVDLADEDDDSEDETAGWDR
jgi:hypothetical protein